MKDVQQSRWRRMSCLSAALTWWYCAVSVCVRVCVEGFIYLHGWPSARNRKRRTGLGSEGLLEKHHASSRSIDIKAGDSFGWLDPGSIWNGCPTPFTLSEWASGSHSVPHQILFKGLSPKRKKAKSGGLSLFWGLEVFVLWCRRYEAPWRQSVFDTRAPYRIAVCRSTSDGSYSIGNCKWNSMLSYAVNVVVHGTAWCFYFRWHHYQSVEIDR